MPEVLTAVHCYQGDGDFVKQTLSWHERHGKVLVLSPEDSPVDIEGVECRSAGVHGWGGPHTVVRQWLHWQILAEYPFDWFLLNDSDSFVLELPKYVFEEDVFWSNFKTPYTDEELTAEPLRDCYYVQPPYFMHRGILEKFIAAGPPPEIYIDKMYATQAKALGMVSKPYRPWGAMLYHPFKDLRNLIQHEQRMTGDGSDSVLALEELRKTKNELKNARQEIARLKAGGEHAATVVSASEA